MAFAFIIATFAATLIGGLIGLRYKDKLHLLLGFTAGVLLAVVALEILPEIFELVGEMGIDIKIPMFALIVGFLVFHIGEKLLLIHHSHEDHYGEHSHPVVGKFSALALAGHSFVDGLAIGLGFQVSAAAGIAVAIAVLAHDFTDGLNTVSLLLRHNSSQKSAIKFLILVAVAPVLGGVVGLFVTLPPIALLAYLGAFAGFLLYIGASDILPEAHSRDSSLKTVFATILGVIFVVLVSTFIHH